ncbi:MULTISPECIES: AAA domain-containing protein [unclassified Campylobacter]|uniref:AAA domain-containing protein n=1 Tax=unclassified Campylobacter TaxID=2593542 RepID=UPI0022E99885|nr:MULTISPECIES: AAA domain-containing protein [unclassified Campylobacter]MDA3054944.1 AAA domain-containing protein [Campylobacter sp. VBCF_07 NA4]MDA3060446.1 AAA domain-containing protein [Campylobacter sp. VBCF_02 NA5]MDA3070288.1 AAA domain-containing protein [Campylobacter sp. VBCF_08 NA3]WBR54718.1 AAA domain-containing protein [Campylobacter sp. VBCF_01 NA2]
MKYSIGKVISKSIKESKWLSIEYVNQYGKTSYFWCAVLDIDVEYKKLKIDMFNIGVFNHGEGIDAKGGNIFFDKIKRAKVIDGTYYSCEPHLIDKIEKNISELAWLEFDNFDDKILEYYSEAKKLDVDPCQNDYSNVDGIDVRTLLKNEKILLSDEQFKSIVNDIYDKEKFEQQNKYSQLAINKLSIYDNNKLYVVAYYPLFLDIKEKSLMINGELIINNSFLIDGNKKSLAEYLSMNPSEFAGLLQVDYENTKELLRENLNSNEKLDENPLFMLITREIRMDFDPVYEGIVQKHKNGTLEHPLKAFFGELSKRNMGKTEPNIVLMDKNVNIDQIRVVYNAMKNPVTYVQGPPGTGKTTTLMNVVLSSFLNDRTCLICSNNNHPIDDILKKFKFKYKHKEIPFPIIRLGNRVEIGKSLDRIRILLEKNDENIKIYDDRLKEIGDKTSKRYSDLKSLLAKYEEKQELLQSKAELDKFYDFVMNNEKSSKKLKDKLAEQKNTIEEKLQNLPDISNEEVLSNVKFVGDDSDFLMYLYFSSFKFIKRLKQPSYKDLRDIISIDDKENQITEFTKWLKQSENFKKFLKIFPVIACTNIACLKLGDNEAYFDICIMDEAGQCDVAASLVPISKAKRLLLVGDVNQLQPITTLDNCINDKLMEKYEVPRQYDYCGNSIMNLMSRVDEISTKILLSYHYRCGKKIADYSNHRYYGGKLNIQTSLGENQLEYVKVRNKEFASERNSYLAEALAVVEYIKENKLDENSVTVITPFRNQAHLIQSELAKQNLNVKCGTIHTVQGSENQTIIFSPAIGVKSSLKTYEWLANNKELINVAVTRAKDKLVLVADDEALEALSNKEMDDDIASLSHYVKQNGNISVSHSKVNKIEIGLSNSSRCEKEFFETITHFCSVYKKFSVKRNQSVSKVLKSIDDEELKSYFTKAEFDLVLYSKDEFGATKPRLAIELNGGEHYISKSKSIDNDKKKMQICQKCGISYLCLPNSYSKSYETISNLIFALNGESDEEYNLFSQIEP